MFKFFYLSRYLIQEYFWYVMDKIGYCAELYFEYTYFKEYVLYIEKLSK